jgi:hypothetical protein
MTLTKIGAEINSNESNTNFNNIEFNEDGNIAVVLDYN